MEFQKLDLVDKKVALWMMDQEPRAVKDWLEEIRTSYAREKDIHLNKDQLYQEIVSEYQLRIKSLASLL